jgi:hypothetical protein
MTYPKDENGRYLIPAKNGETRIEADCSCGDGWNIPERVWDWISDRHHLAHRKGRDGLPGGRRIDVARLEPGRPAQYWTAPGRRSPQQEAEAGS